jgi:hypothetical protein
MLAWHGPAVDPARAPIFVIGTGRSGTTLLRCMLCAHPRIYITHEASFYLLERFYPRRAPRRDYLNWYFQSIPFRWLRLAPDEVLDGLPDPLPPERIGDAYAAIMGAKASHYGRPRFGDKTPFHSGCLRRIFQDFPDARVIHIVRDPRSTVESLARMPWASPSLHANAIYCKLERQQVRKFDDRLLRVRLEDLLAEPRATMGKILDYVGEPWDDAVLDHANHLPDKNDMPPVPWFENAMKERIQEGPRWSGMTPVEIRMIERVAKVCMEVGGYEPAPLSSEPGRFAVWWRGVREIPQLVRGASLLGKVAKMTRDPRTLESPEGRALMRQINPEAWKRYPAGFDFPLPPPLASGRLLEERARSA